MHLLKPLLPLFVFVCSLSCWGGRSGILPGAMLPDEFALGKGSAWRWHGLDFALQSTYGNWNYGTFWLDGEQVIEQGALQRRFTVKHGGQAGAFDLRLLGPERNRLQVMSRCEVPASLNGKLKFLSLTLPVKEARKIRLRTARGEQREIVFPAVYGKTALGQVNGVREGSILLTDGRQLDFRFRGTVYVQDNRAFRRHGRQLQNVAVRFWFADQALQADFRWNDLVVTPVCLTGYANRSFRDDYADDVKGGWTDQGASNDLRMLPSGRHSYGNMVFQVADEGKTGKPGAIVVAGNRPFAPTEVSLPLPSTEKPRSLLLLHAAAWCSGKVMGELEISYADTSKQTIELVRNRDLANWWSPEDAVNAKVAWRNQNPERNVGLYASAFTLTGHQPVNVVFRARSKACWMIAGVSLANVPFALEEKTAHPLVTKADSQWIPMNFQRRTKPGSPLDFSFLLRGTAPAGKYGRVTVSPEGTLTLADRPEARLRLYGVNLCESMNFVTHETAVQLADFIASQGYNSVRFHHHDRGLRHGTDPTPGVLDPENLDRLDFLAAELIKRGIYLTFDFYTSRRLIEGEELAILKRYPKLGTKFAIQFTPEGRENWKAFAKAWMTHRNPYTGRTWAEEPAIAFANLVNEDVWTYGFLSNRDRLAFLTERFQAYCRSHVVKDTTVHLGNPDFYGFLVGEQTRCTLELADYLRRELGVRFLLTSGNFSGNLATTLYRDAFEVVDDHMYKDHPTFPKRSWCHPHAFSQTSTMPAYAYLPVSIVRARIFDKPFFMTEFNFCAPNVYRSEGGPLIGAYGALQNCSGFYRFCLSHNRKRFMEHVHGPVCFESVTDPIMQLSDRIASVMYLRGDVATAKDKVVETLPRNFWDRKRDTGFGDTRLLGLLTQIGIQMSDRPVKNTVEYSNLQDPELKRRLEDIRRTGVARSMTDELELDTKHSTFKVMTPKTESLTLTKGTLKGRRMTVTGADTFQTVCAISLDNEPLETSRSILILQLSNVCGTGEKYTDQDRKVQEHIGKEPLLLRRARATIALNLPHEYRIQALDMQGEAKAELRGTRRGDAFVFQADNGATPGGLVGYHLTRP